MIEDAFCAFNEVFDYHFSADNVAVQLYSDENAVQVYNEFVSGYVFEHESITEDYSQSVGGEAFIGGRIDGVEIDGILLKIYSELSEEQLYHTTLHELSHIFCCREEIEGGHFYKRFCSMIPNTPEERFTDGIINAGYAIWKEFIAEFYAQVVDSDSEILYHVFEYEDSIRQRLEWIVPDNPSAKYDMSFLLVSILSTVEGLSDSWDELEGYLRDMRFPFVATVRIVYEQVHTDKAHVITWEFISELGNVYLFEMGNRFIDLIGNGIE